MHDSSVSTVYTLSLSNMPFKFKSPFFSSILLPIHNLQTLSFYILLVAPPHVIMYFHIIRRFEIFNQIIIFSMCYHSH